MKAKVSEVLETGIIVVPQIGDGEVFVWFGDCPAIQNHPPLPGQYVQVEITKVSMSRGLVWGKLTEPSGSLTT
jgi:hypothetical protein